MDPSAITESGTKSGARQVRSSLSAVDFDAVVVGASFSGLWNLHLLKQQGLGVLLVDACDDVGGSWQYHQYPGCGVDAEVPYYEFSDKKLWSDWDWSEKFPSQEEIQRYLKYVCNKLDLGCDLRLRTKVSAAHWDDNDQIWRLFFKGTAKPVTCRYFISCTGYATIPYIPDFPGLETFSGEAFHTSKWPKDLEYKEKRVGIIGTGSSGVQLIEAIAGEVSKLVVFQRTPNLATPKRQERLTVQRRKDLKNQYEAIFEQRRTPTGYAITHTNKMSDHSPSERQDVWENLWRQGGSKLWRDNYVDYRINKETSRAVYEFWLQKTLCRIKDPQVAETLAPRDPPYAFGTRRPALETRYFEVFNQTNVELIDLNKEGIVRIDEGGIRTPKAYYEIDILVLATGFDFITGSMLALDIRGRNGQPLTDKWKVKRGEDGVWTYLGLMTNGFPNMFFPMGPQAPTALAFTPHMAEVQGGWICECISRMRAQKWNVIEPKKEAEQWWKREVTKASDATLFPGTKSWYMGQNSKHRMEQALCYLGGVDVYIDTLEREANREYPGFTLT